MQENVHRLYANNTVFYIRNFEHSGNFVFMKGSPENNPHRYQGTTEFNK
jgi:hypothetical protein